MEQQTLIKNALKQSYSYQEYRELVESHAQNQTNTGAEITEDLARYTVLNHQRMKRLDKTMKIDEHFISRLQSVTNNLSLLVITESWCGDAAQTMPMIAKVAATANIPLQIVLRDENELLMDQFLTNGGRSIPIVILYRNDTYQPIDRWGPRPKPATQLVAQEKENKGYLSAEFKQELQVWYNKDKGQSTLKDLFELMNSHS